MATVPPPLPAFNARRVENRDATYQSATTDVYTGILSEGKLQQVRDRAVYDDNSLEWHPLASAGKGILFEGALEATTKIETEIRARPSTFKGRQQLDVIDEDQGHDVHINRRLHPAAWAQDKLRTPGWSNENKGEKGLFRGYPNPDLFYRYTEAIPTHNVQNLSNAQLATALRTTEFDGGKDWTDLLGSVLKNGAGATIEHPSKEQVVPSDGGGISADPRMMASLANEFNTDFEIARRLQVASATEDPRFHESAPSRFFMEQEESELLRREDYFGKIAQIGGFATSYTHPEQVKR